MIREAIFIENFKAILDATNQGFKLEKIVGLPLATEGMLGDLIDSYGWLLIEVIFPKRDDVLSDIFWNATVNNDENMSIEDIRKLFKELDTHNG